MNLADCLFQTARRFPDKTFLRFYDREITFARCRDDAARLAGALTALGVTPGDRVAIALPNVPEFAVCYYGALMAGAVALTINPLYTAYEMGWFVRDARPKVFITHPLFMEAAAGAVAGADARLLYSDPMGDPAKEGIAGLMDSCEPLKAPVPREAGDLACLVYSSAADGVPKGVMLTHGNLLSNAESCRQVSLTDETDGFLAVIPLYHAFAATTCMNLPLLAGAEVEFQETFSEKRAFESIRRGKVSVFCVVPAALQRIYEYGQSQNAAGPFPNLRRVIPGGAKMREDLQRELEAFFAMPVCEGYGITEAGPVSSVNPLDDASRRKIGSVGLPLPGVEIEIVDERGVALPNGRTGELVVRGPNVMKGYWNQPEATKEAVKDGALFTGDLGYKDEDGYLYLTGLKKRMFIVGGLNVYPREVELALMKIPGVKACRVDGVPDPLMGSQPGAWIVWDGDGPPGKREIQKSARRFLAPYKVPKTIEFVKELE